MGAYFPIGWDPKYEELLTTAWLFLRKRFHHRIAGLFETMERRVLLGPALCHDSALSKGSAFAPSPLLHMFCTRRFITIFTGFVTVVIGLGCNYVRFDRAVSFALAPAANPSTNTMWPVSPKLSSVGKPSVSQPKLSHVRNGLSDDSTSHSSLQKVIRQERAPLSNTFDASGYELLLSRFHWISALLLSVAAVVVYGKHRASTDKSNVSPHFAQWAMVAAVGRNSATEEENPILFAMCQSVYAILEDLEANRGMSFRELKLIIGVISWPLRKKASERACTILLPY